MTENFKIGDRVRLKIDPKFGAITWINGMGLYATINWGLGVEDTVHIKYITKEPHKNFICKCTEI